MKKSRIAILILSLAGLLFSGYMTFTKLFSGTCSLTEGCQYLFGYPTCLYGFVIFLALSILSIIRAKKIRTWIAVVSGIGILFSGYYVIYDIMNWTGSYSLVLPSCFYGFLIYVLIFVLSFIGRK